MHHNLQQAQFRSARVRHASASNALVQCGRTPAQTTDTARVKCSCNSQTVYCHHRSIASFNYSTPRLRLEMMHTQTHAWLPTAAALSTSVQTDVIDSNGTHTHHFPRCVLSSQKCMRIPENLLRREAPNIESSFCSRHVTVSWRGPRCERNC
jgi:hypothetical protein